MMFYWLYSIEDSDAQFIRDTYHSQRSSPGREWMKLSGGYKPMTL